MTAKRTRYFAQFFGILIVAACALVIYHFGYANATGQLQLMIQQAGFLAPLLFIGLQIIQVTFPIIPGGLSTVAAVSLFGAGWGFVYNYIGICLGSICAFMLARRFGQPMIEALIPEKTLTKYTGYLNSAHRFERLFTLAILLPVAPDDLLCLLAGLTTMSRRKFITIILLCKPWTILAYSLGVNTVVAHLFG